MLEDKIIENSDSENKEKNKSFFSEIKDFSLETVKIVVISLIVIVAIRTYVMQPFFVSGKSMEPNFHDGDYLIVDEISYRLDEPKRGDVIIFRYPKNTKEFFIKRIVGLPGERVEIKDSGITIYNNENQEGMTLDEDVYIPLDTKTTGSYDTILKDDEYYVLGDNRNASADSRIWGVLEEHFIIGKAWIRAWPVGDFSVFEGVEYEIGNIE
ncbi:signal peptidase I [Candidatus Parcubacteria bacterium]|nr:signal peptidase I [Candidatus Parcubacteria bacterium]